MSLFFSSALLGRKLLSPFHRRDVKTSFYQDTEIPIWGWSSLRRGNVGLEHHWCVWGTMEPRTTKRKYYKTFYAKRESVMRVPKDTALNQMDWMRESTLPSWTYRYKLDSQALALCYTFCSTHLQWTFSFCSQNDAYGDSSDFSKLYVFVSICCPFHPLFLHLEKNGCRLESLALFGVSPMTKIHLICPAAWISFPTWSLGYCKSWSQAHYVNLMQRLEDRSCRPRYLKCAHPCQRHHFAQRALKKSAPSSYSRLEVLGFWSIYCS